MITTSRHASTPAASIASVRGWMPAASSIALTVKAITIAVPRSGCVTTSTQAAPTTSSSGRVSSRRLRTQLGRLAISVAQYSTSAIFNSSDGWNWRIPGPIQRRAPFTLTPTCGMWTANTSASEVNSSGAVMR